MGGQTPGPLRVTQDLTLGQEPRGADQRRLVVPGVGIWGEEPAHPGGKRRTLPQGEEKALVRAVL